MGHTSGTALPEEFVPAVLAVALEHTALLTELAFGGQRIACSRSTFVRFFSAVGLATALPTDCVFVSWRALAPGMAGVISV